MLNAMVLLHTIWTSNCSSRVGKYRGTGSGSGKILLNVYHCISKTRWWKGNGQLSLDDLDRCRSPARGTNGYAAELTKNFRHDL